MPINSAKSDRLLADPILIFLGEFDRGSTHPVAIGIKVKAIKELLNKRCSDYVTIIVHQLGGTLIRLARKGQGTTFRIATSR